MSTNKYTALLNETTYFEFTAKSIIDIINEIFLLVF